MCLRSSESCSECWRLKINGFGVHTAARLIPNEDSDGPLDKSMEKLVFRKFNIETACMELQLIV